MQLPDGLADLPLTWLDSRSLKRCALVCRDWRARAEWYATSVEHGRVLAAAAMRAIAQYIIDRNPEKYGTESSRAKVAARIATVVAQMPGTGAGADTWDL